MRYHALPNIEDVAIESPALPQQQQRGAASAYGTIIRATETSRQIEARVLSDLAIRLSGANSFARTAEAVHDNRMLWMTFAIDLADDTNTLPLEVRARLISLASWVSSESDRVLQQGASTAALADVNRAIAAGLRASPDQSATPQGAG